MFQPEAEEDLLKAKSLPEDFDRRNVDGKNCQSYLEINPVVVHVVVMPLALACHNDVKLVFTFCQMILKSSSVLYSRHYGLFLIFSRLSRG